MAAFKSLFMLLFLLFKSFVLSFGLKGEIKKLLTFIGITDDFIFLFLFIFMSLKFIDLTFILLLIFLS